MSDTVTISVAETESVTVSVGEAVPSVAPANWVQWVAEYGRGYNFPLPTGQTTSYRTGDDANIESTVFGSTVRNAETLKARNTLASFLVLNNNNSFGNTNRFTDDAGGQTYTNTYVIDHYTGLAWYPVITIADSWDDNIDGALASTQYGFSDWFLPNVLQLNSIAKEGNADEKCFNYAPFNLSTSVNFDTSTTLLDNTLKNYEIRNSYWIVYGFTNKSSGSNITIICRKHF